MKITKEQKERILKLDPNFCDEKLEAGKWYKHKYFKNTIIHKVDNLGYGLWNGVWDNNWLIKSVSNWTLATEKEVETALINEAKRRGLKQVNFKCLIDGIVWEFDSEQGFKYNQDTNNMYIDAAVAFDNGKWAEIIQTITKAEAEKLLNKIIIFKFHYCRFCHF